MTPAELLEKEGITYKHSGKDLLILCLNPDHDDSNPSMRIDKTVGIFNCMSCGYKGNIFNYFGVAQNQLRLKFSLLKNKIRDKRLDSVGMDIPSEALPYSGTWRGISKETYRHFEAFEHHSNDMRSRINFPIRDITGSIVAFIGRHTAEETPKYRVIPDGARLPLFPLHLFKPIQGSALLVEGLYDFLNCYDNGFENALCCFGTRMVSDKKLELLKIRGVSALDIFFDGDEAGQVAAEEIKVKAEKAGFTVRNINLPGKDPGELTKKQLQSLKGKLYG